jgi:two-component system response regulator AtoC
VNETYRVLVAEDEVTYGRTVARYLEGRGHEVRVATTGKGTIKALSDADGVDLLAQVRQDHADVQTIIVTGFANVESAIGVMRLGAFDYVTKPPNFEELAVKVEKAGEKAMLERENRRLRYQTQRNLSSEIVTRSPALKKVLDTLAKVAPAKMPVLIEGESGVGKELVAQHLHRISPRATRAFIDLNCAAVPATLLESELFGHERGAFTGAGTEKPGLVEVADGGTLFLDEIGEMSPEIQSKLLRLLDSGTFYRVGATRKRRADFRLVAATNRDLREEVKAGRFRKDLFFRVHGVRVVIPPLRERPEDVPLLVDYFSRGLPSPRPLSPAALRALAAYDWPGNVREMRFAIERAALLAEGETIEVEDLPPEILESGRVRSSSGVSPAAAPAETFDDDGDDDATDEAGLDRERVVEALEKARWRRGKAAEILGVSPRTLYRWMRRLGL